MGVLTRLGGLQPAFATAGPVTLIVVATVIAARLSWVFPAMYLPRWLSPARRAREPAPSMGIGLVVGLGRDARRGEPRGGPGVAP